MPRSLALPRALRLAIAAAALAIACGIACSADARSAVPGVPASAPDGAEASSQRLERDALAREAQARLGAWLHGRVDRFEVEPDLSTIPSITIPQGVVQIHARPLDDYTRIAARVPVWLDVFVDGRPSRSVLVTSRVRAYAFAWTAKADLAAGTRLSGEWLNREEVDIAASGVVPWRGEPGGTVLRSALLRGRVVTAMHVALPSAVSRGERVLLSSRVNGIEVISDALALQDAKVGQRIQVQPGAAQGPVLATVLEPGRVEISR